MVRNEDILKDILLKMNYDTSKTLNENIQEQGSADIFVDQRAMSLAGIEYNDYKTQQWEASNKALKQIGEWLQDPHVLLPLGALIVTVATGGIGGLVVAGLLEAADVALYIEEGDYTSAGLGAIFLLIPGAQLIRKLGVGEITEKQIKTLINKVSKGLDLNPFERKIIQAIDDNKNWIRPQVLKQTAKGLSKKVLMKSVAKKSAKAFIYTILRMSQMGLLSWKFGWRVAALGGVFLTALQMGKILGVGLENWSRVNVELPDSYVMLDQRQKAEVRKELAQEVIEASYQNNIQTEILKASEEVIDYSSEAKVEEINKTFSKLDEKLDDL